MKRMQEVTERTYKPFSIQKEQKHSALFVSTIPTIYASAEIYCLIIFIVYFPTIYAIIISVVTPILATERGCTTWN